MSASTTLQAWMWTPCPPRADPVFVTRECSACKALILGVNRADCNEHFSDHQRRNHNIREHSGEPTHAQ